MKVKHKSNLSGNVSTKNTLKLLVQTQQKFNDPSCEVDEKEKSDEKYFFERKSASIITKYIGKV